MFCDVLCLFWIFPKYVSRFLGAVVSNSFREFPKLNFGFPIKLRELFCEFNFGVKWFGS
ncbi:leucine-rich repeat extensin-like protein 3 [Iris pallida]|uniref:Leucine-rich repeat extensin-like protein 3 n=1 Tax=Iris pallida TaxID=29817 RepID=A0AAX6GEW0_IRIPA|nr:leucine-rich repeat extensin-like protein 3 [Iris pallida]